MSLMRTMSAAVLCILCMSACAVDDPERPSTQSAEPASEVVEDVAPALDPSLTGPITNNSALLEGVFGDGCHIAFRCHDDSAQQRPAFCTRTNCFGSAHLHASAFCSNHCSAGTNCNAVNITNFGGC